LWPIDEKSERVELTKTETEERFEEVIAGDVTIIAKHVKLQTPPSI